MLYVSFDCFLTKIEKNLELNNNPINEYMKKLNEYIKSPLNLEELMNVKGGIVGGTANSGGSVVVSGWGSNSLLGSAALISIAPISIISPIGLTDCDSMACKSYACTHESCTQLTCRTNGCKTKQMD